MHIRRMTLSASRQTLIILSVGSTAPIVSQNVLVIRSVSDAVQELDVEPIYQLPHNG